ncbi:MAG: RNA polymerase sigma factor SigJ, partial [Pseudomonadota bacterium]|nr:RNA polymerase sigma factor SigJ [Pseudomonadota bacterium]
ASEALEAHRPPLFALAYRMLGRVSEAEDVVQDAFLRWLAADRAGVERPGAWLATAATRLCLDRLRAARRARALYVGPWLPEPLPEGRDAAPEPVDPAPGPEESVAQAQAVSVALMLALDRLTPLERAAFLLHDVFGAGFAEVAATLGRSEPACRQLASRARTRLRADRADRADLSLPDRARPAPPPVPDPAAARVADAFFAALRSGDPAGLAAVLAEDAALVTDGGGHARAALNPILGADRIRRFFAGIQAKRGAVPTVRTRRMAFNDLPGELSEDAEGRLQTIALDLVPDPADPAGPPRVAAIYVTRNPDKLAHLRGLFPDAPA